jgi:hypothetical protein
MDHQTDTGQCTPMRPMNCDFQPYLSPDWRVVAQTRPMEHIFCGCTDSTVHSSPSRTTVTPGDSSNVVAGLISTKRIGQPATLRRHCIHRGQCRPYRADHLGTGQLPRSSTLHDHEASVSRPIRVANKL